MEGSEYIGYSHLHHLSEASPYWLHLWIAAFYGKVWKDPIILILCNGINTEYSCIYKCKMYVLKSEFIIMTVKKDWLGLLLLNTVFLHECLSRQEKYSQIHKHVCVCGFMYVCRPQDFLRGGVISLKKWTFSDGATQGKRCFFLYMFPLKRGVWGPAPDIFEN